MGWRTLVGLVAGLAAGYFVALGFGLPALLGLTFGGLLGLLPGLLVADAPAGELARSLAWYLPPPRSARHQRADALLDRLSEGARQVRTIVWHVPPSPSRPGVVTPVTPLIETLKTTIATLDRWVDEGELPELISSGKHAHSSGKHAHGQRSRLTAATLT